MNVSEKLYTWDKGEKTQINKYFNTSEFDCQCKHKECVKQQVSKQLIDNLTKVREECKLPIEITSGFRCSAHQKEMAEAGVNTVVAKLSQHELGEAVDCRPKGMSIDAFYKIAEKRFKAIGVAKTFLHLDTRSDKIRRWTY